MMQLLTALVALAAGQAADLEKAASQAVSEDRYDDAIRLLEDERQDAKRARDGVRYVRLREEIERVRQLERTWKRLERHRQAVAEAKESPRAHLAVGRFYAFQKGDYAAGLPLLVKGADETLAGLASRDLAGPESDFSKVSLGRSWWDAAAKAKKDERDAIRARALHWYKSAWPSLDATLKNAIRPQIAEALRKPNGYAAAQPLEGWTYHQGKAAGVASDSSVSGGRSLKIYCDQLKSNFWIASGEPIRLTPGQKYTLSAWFRTSETVGSDFLVGVLSTVDGKGAKELCPRSTPDFPFWHRAAVEFTAPPGDPTLTIRFRDRKPHLKGIVWVDGVSLTEEGRELVANGSFER